MLGVKKELTDRSYLHGRGITDATLDSPAFQGRIFTAQQNEHKNTAFPLYNEHGLASVEQKNEHYKSLLPLPKNGIWVSHPTEGKDTPVERVVVSESAIDSLSHFQLKHGQDPKNTLYIATSGTPTEAQVALIQRVIDKQEPQEVVLANDRDAGGRQFNINYLNELQPARPLVPVAEQEAYHEATRPVEWHATSDKYHTSLKVSFHHDTPEQGAGQVQQLSERVAKINSTQEAGPTLAAGGDAQHRPADRRAHDRGARRCHAAGSRSPGALPAAGAAAARAGAPAGNLSAGGLSAGQGLQQRAGVHHQGLSAEQIRAPPSAKSSSAKRSASSGWPKPSARSGSSGPLEREAQRERGASPEAQKEREQDDKRFNQAVLGAAGRGRTGRPAPTAASRRRQSTPRSSCTPKMPAWCC